MIKAAITPGTQPHKVNSETIMMLPQPLSKTAKGGKIIARITLKQLIGMVINGNGFRPY